MAAAANYIGRGKRGADNSEHSVVVSVVSGGVGGAGCCDVAGRL